MQDVPSWQECKTICTQGLGGAGGGRVKDWLRGNGGLEERGRRGDLRTGGCSQLGASPDLAKVDDDDDDDDDDMA